jgi:hypothetical protein
MPEAPLLRCCCIEGRAIWSGVLARRTAGASGLIPGDFHYHLAEILASFHETPRQCWPPQGCSTGFSNHTRCEELQEKNIRGEKCVSDISFLHQCFTRILASKILIKPHSFLCQTPQKLWPNPTDRFTILGQTPHNFEAMQHGCRTFDIYRRCMLAHVSKSGKGAAVSTAR